MTDSVQELAALVDAASAEIRGCVSIDDLEQIRVRLLGKKGVITEQLKMLGSMDPETKKAAGARINTAKATIVSALDVRRAELDAQALAAQLANDTIDVTLPGRGQPIGGLHPLTRVRRRIEQIFRAAGFAVADGPDIEDDWHNFEALNIPANHPARAMHDTFYFPDGRLLRTHTSPVQIRVLQEQKPPVRVIVPGRVYRMDSDMTHTPMFHQVEGLVIDTQSHIGQLRWVLEEFLKAFFEIPNVTLRFRPSFFPFTEPSMEVDVQCDRSGSEIKIGEGSDWLEILGCGMVHPNVLRNVGLDPDIYQGFAWGMGIDRIAMLKYGMPDLRAFFDADKRWLDHYGFRAFDMPTLFGGLSS